MGSAWILAAGFVLPAAYVWWKCRKELFGRTASAFERQDAAVGALTAAVLGTLLLCPFAVGWLSCVIYRTGAEAWPFVFVSWTGVFAGALVARLADASKVGKIVDIVRAQEKRLNTLGSELGLTGYNHEPYSFRPEDYRADKWALWWLRNHDDQLPKVERSAYSDESEALFVDGMPVGVLSSETLEILASVHKIENPLPLIAALLVAYEPTARAKAEAERLEREKAKREIGG